MKRFTKLLLTMAMLVGVSLSTFAANEVTTTIIDGYMYQLFDDNTARLLPNYFNLDVVIPSTVTYSNKSYTVTAIDEEAFKNRTQVTSVSIPNTVTTIGNYAFSGCTALTSISLPSSVTKIGSYAFKDCSSLTSVVLTASNEQITIASNVFEGCSNEVYNSYDNALYIGTGANPYLYLMKVTSTDITSCQIHPNCKYINDYAFEGCDNLTEIPISNTITYIGKYVFHGCTGLTSITIPGSVTAIGDCAFDGCSALASLTLNSGVTTIGSCAFRGCSSLTTVTVPRSVISIGSTAFGGCSALESITLPFVGRAALAVDDYSQYHYPFGCIFGTTSYAGGTATEQDVYTSQSDHYDLTYYIPSSLKTVTIDAADNDVAILEGAFYNCTKLTSVSLNQVTSIEARAFWNCTSLTTITIPQSVTSIARGVFDGCMALETMTLPFPGTQKYTPAMVETEISENPDGDNYGFYFKSIFVQRYSYSYYSSLRTVNITNCEYLPYNTFSDCNKITSITLPDNLTTIGEKAFYNCTNLTSTTIPSNVTTVGENAYQYCNSIASIITESTADLSAANLRFSKDGFNYRVLNKSTVELTGSSNTTGTVTIPATVTCGNTFTVISIASKAFWNFTDVSSVSVPETVSTIGDNAFYHVPLLQYSGTAEGSPWGAEIRIIIDGDFAYYDAEKTKLVAYFGTGGDVVVPNTVTEIYSTTFKNCVGLTSVTIPSSVTSINGSAFSGCTNLTKVTLNNNTIASKTYTSSSNFKTIFGSQVEEFVLGEGVTSIGESAFNGCTGLTSVTIPSSVSTMGNYAFSGCTGLTSITIPEGVTEIGFRAFHSCTGLTSITIPESVTSIDNEAFIGWSNAQEFVFEGETPPSFGTSVFYGSSCPIYVPTKDAITAYKAATNMSNYASRIQVKPYEVDGVKYQIQEDGTFAVVASNYSGDVVIRSSVDYNGVATAVTSIADNAFKDCIDLTAVTIPSNVTSVGGSAFGGCTNLTKVTINSNAVASSGSSLKNIFGTQVPEYVLGEDVTKIGNNAFFGCTGLTSVTIPESVTSIGGSAFSGCTGLTSITIPEGVTSIGGSAFSGCTGLTSVTIPESVTSIGDYAFSGCTNLTKVTINSNAIASSTYTYNSTYLGSIFGTQVTEYVLGEGVTSIGEYAFRECTRITSVTIPETVTSIGNYAFSRCTGLTSLTIPESVTSIGNYAFYKCTGLTSVTIPESITSIGNSAFEDCKNVQMFVFEKETPPAFGSDVFKNSTCPIYVPNASAVTAYKAADNMNSYADRVKIMPTIVIVDGIKYQLQDDGTFAVIANNYSGDVVIPSSIDYNGVATTVTSIAANAFYGCTDLTAVTIPSSVTSIESDVFKSCTNLTKVILNSNAIASNTYTYYSNLGNIFGKQVAEYVLGEDVTSIGEYAFYGCTDLTSITIPEGVTSIGNYAFDGCYGLTSVTIPKNVTSIGDYAFYNCTGLTSITIPEGVTTIGSYAFYNCTGLTSVTIPSSVTLIGSDAFKSCTNLTKVTLNSNAVASYNSYNTYNFNFYTIFGFQVTEYVLGEGVTSIGDYAFYGCTRLTSVTIPEGVTSIGNNTFYNCTDLTSITIPEGVTSIGNSAFYGCTGLTSVTIPEGVTSIGNSAFYNCKKLTSIIIPESVRSIGNYVFYNCSKVQEFVFEDETPPSFGTSVFYGSSCPIYVPTEEAVTAYKAATNMSNYASRIQVMPIFVVVDGVKYQLQDNGTFAVVANNYSGEVNTIRESIDYNGVATAVTSIAANAFEDCTGLTSVTIPSSVTSIGSDAFYGCTNLTKVTLNSNAITSKTYTWNNNLRTIFGSQVTEYVWGENVTKIGAYAFYGSTGLTSLTIPESVTSIGEDAFKNCTGLTSITIPESVTTIGVYAFDGCTNLTKVTLHSNTIASQTSYNSRLGAIFGTQVTEYVLDENLTEIGECAFYDCTGLTSITIPESVTSIGYEAFWGCTGLTSITIPESVTSIGGSAFSVCTGLTSIIINSDADLKNAKLSFSKDGIKYQVLDKNSVTVVANSYSGEVAIPDSVTFGNTFNVTSIDDNAFKNCTDLTTVTVPSSITSIGSNAFSGCTNLTKVTINSNAIASKKYGWRYNLTNIFGSQVTEYVWGENVTSIGDYALYGCTDMPAVTIPESVTKIGESAFSGCTGLTSVTIPESVTSIGYGAFNNCSNVQEFVFEGETPPTFGNYVFNGSSCPIYVPTEEAVTAYKTATNMSDYASRVQVMPIYTISVVANNDEYGTVSGGGTYDVRETPTVTISATAIEPYQFAYWNEDGSTEATRTITITENATYTAVFKRVLTISNITVSEKVYDGTTSAQINYTTDGILEGDDVTVTCTASFDDENVGVEKTVTLHFELEGEDASNYAINAETTELKSAITAYTSVEVTITENSGTETYDGTEKTVTGYVVEINTDLYTESDFTFNGTAEVKGSNAGTYEMNIVASDFENINDNFANVTFTVVDGKLTIEKSSETPNMPELTAETRLLNITDVALPEGWAWADETIALVEGENSAVANYVGDDAGNYTVESVTITITRLPCLHDGEYTIVDAKEATCTVDGYTGDHKCSICGAIFEQGSVIPAKGHNAGEPVIENYIAPTCTEAGTVDTVVYCTIDNEEISRKTSVLPATGHIAGEAVVENYVAPTCTEAGTVDTVYYCTIDGDLISRETYVLEAKGHQPGKKVAENLVPATITSEGSVDSVTYCTVCGEELSREHFVLPILDHEHIAGEPVVENYVAPTCTEAGAVDTVVYCTVNGEELSREHFVLPALGHTAGEAVVENYVAPTCTEAGTVDTVYYCTIDGELISKETYELPATGHKPSEKVAINYVPATTTTEGSVDSVITCTVCGEVLYSEHFVLPILDHEHIAGAPVEENRVEPTCMVDGSVDTVVYCTVNGEELSREQYVLPALGHKPSEKIAKNYVAPTCTEAGSVDSVVTCTVCGEVLSDEHYELPATGHIAGEAVVENYVAPTCTEAGTVDTVYYCTIDNEEINRETYELPALGHKAGEKVAENYVAPTKTEDGSVDSVVYCTIGGEELSRESFVLPAIGHDHIFGEPVAENYKAPTCTEAGSVDTVVYCMVEGEELSRETYVLPMLEHVAGEKVAENYVAPTKTEDGSVDSVVYCTICGEELSRESFVLPAIGHDHIFGEPVAENYKAPTCTEAGSVDTVVYCLVDGEELSRETYVLPMLEHVAGEKVAENYVAPTATEEGSVDSVVYCTICGEELSRESYVLPIETTAISDVTADAPSIYAFGHTIVVETTAFIGSDIVVYDINGRIIATVSATNEHTEINVSRVGVYGVRIANVSATVMIR